MELRSQAVSSHFVVQRVAAPDAWPFGTRRTKWRQGDARGSIEGVGGFSEPSPIQAADRRDGDFATYAEAEISALLALRFPGRAQGDGGNGADKRSAVRRCARVTRANGVAGRRLGRARPFLQGLAEHGCRHAVRIYFAGGLGRQRKSARERVGHVGCALRVARGGSDLGKGQSLNLGTRLPSARRRTL